MCQVLECNCKTIKKGLISKILELGYTHPALAVPVLAIVVFVEVGTACTLDERRTVAASSRVLHYHLKHTTAETVVEKSTLQRMVP